MKKAFDDRRDLDRGLLRMAVRSYARHAGLDYEQAHRVMTDYLEANPPPEEGGRREKQLGPATFAEAAEHYRAAIEKYNTNYHHDLAPNFAA